MIVATPHRLTLTLAVFALFCSCATFSAEPPITPRTPEDISLEIIQCDANSCQVSERLIGSMSALPGCLIDLSSVDGKKVIRQFDSFKKPGTNLGPAGEVKVTYHSWLDQTQAKSASILGFLRGGMDKNDRLEVKSTMLPGMAVRPEDLDYEKIAAVFAGKPQEEIDKYGIVMSVVIYEVSAAIYSSSNRKVDVDWPCLSLAGGRTLLYKSGEEVTKCFVMAVYAPIPFCIGLDALAKNAAKNPDTKSNHSATSIGDPGDPWDPKVDLSKITENGDLISRMLKMYVQTHKPAVSLSDAPRAVYANVQ